MTQTSVNIHVAKMFLCAALFFTTNSFAKCYDTVNNVNSKFEFSELIVDTLIQLQGNWKEIAKSESSNVIDAMVAHKQLILDAQCSLNKVSKFGKSTKSNIKTSAPKVTKYLNHLVRYNQNHLDLLSGKFANSPSVQNEKISDHRIDARALQTEMVELSSALVLSTRFEQSDKPSFDLGRIPQNERYNYLGITNIERAKLIEKMLNKLELVSDDKQTIFFHVIYLPVELMTFNDKKIVGLDEIGNP